MTKYIERSKISQCVSGGMHLYRDCALWKKMGAFREMQKVKIAVIDNGVDHTHIAYEIKRKIFVDGNHQCVEDTADRQEANFLHGTICASIIKKFFADSELYSIRILDENGRGFIDRLETALKWCYENNIFVVNLSLGTTYYRDRDKLREMVNFYANRGMCLIAAGANSGYTAYPASFSNVTGVAAGGGKCESLLENKLRGIDVIAPAGYEISLYGQKYTVPKSNSYAAPYVTALYGRLLLEKGCSHVKKLKNELMKAVGNDIRIVGGYREPDWVSHAQLWAKHLREREYYYFKTTGDTEESPGAADTLIIDDLAGLERGLLTDKHIVYLGREKYEGVVNDRFFWSPYEKEKLISGCGECSEGFEIPLILCRCCDDMDEIFLLVELKRHFAEEGYHIYTAGMRAEGVLCGLDYIPVESMDDADKVIGYISRQTRLRQCDGIILGGNAADAAGFKNLFLEIDVEITVKKADRGYDIFMCTEGNAIGRQCNCAEINEKLVKGLTDKIISVFTEEQDDE